jgi:hypothetical protein
MTDEKRFADRNYMVEVYGWTPVKNKGTDLHNFCTAWLRQKHPYGYDIDYFDTVSDAECAIQRAKERNPDTDKYRWTFKVYRLEEVADYRGCNDGR